MGTLIKSIMLGLGWAASMLLSLEGVRSQLCADNLKCVASHPALLLRTAKFAAGNVRLVRQEPAPSKCVQLSTSREVRRYALLGSVRCWGKTDCQI